MSENGGVYTSTQVTEIFRLRKQVNDLIREADIVRDAAELIFEAEDEVERDSAIALLAKALAVTEEM